MSDCCDTGYGMYTTWYSRGEGGMHHHQMGMYHHGPPMIKTEAGVNSDCMMAVDYAPPIKYITALANLYMKILANVNYIFFTFNFGQGFFKMFIIIIAIDLFDSIVLTFSPAISMGSIKQEVENIKQHLMNITPHVTDNIVLQELSHAMQVLCWNPIKFRPFGCIEVDKALPLYFLGVCVTHAIAVLQFSTP